MPLARHVLRTKTGCTGRGVAPRVKRRALGCLQTGAAVTAIRVVMSAGLLLGVAAPATGQDLVALAKRTSVASLDSTLPATPLERWLAEVRGIPPSAITWEVNDCGEGGDGRQAPTCVEAVLPLPADSTAHLMLIVAAADGRGSTPAVFDLSVGKGYTFTGFKSLGDWAAHIRHTPR